MALRLPAWGWANTAPPGAWSASSWVQAKRHVVLGQHHPKPAAQRHLALGLLALGCSPNATWLLGCLYF